MHTTYHRSITMQALQGIFSPAALEVVVAANLGQDSLRGQIAHNEYHFDANAFEKSRVYIEQNRLLIRPALEQGDAFAAQRAFGRLTHGSQDFYAHSNYVTLWLARFPDGGWPPPEAIDPFDGGLLDSPDLRSGKLYYPLEVLSFVPFLRRFVLPLIPHDSHAWMNLDMPEQGVKFPYAIAAAVKRTRYEYEATTCNLPEELITLFCS
jgi:hypothetical protein